MHKLVKSLYRLKQTPKQWHKNFDQVILTNGFKVNESNKCIYSKFNEGKGVIVCLYVDDMLIFETDLGQVKVTKTLLSNKFDMKDMATRKLVISDNFSL